MPRFGDTHCKRLLAMQRSDEAGQPFHCLICLELVYKPVVQSCGHVFCFWCVHRAMNRIKQSQCPLCRRPYIHFPQVCELLHFFLMKAAPEEYDRRAEEIQDMEQSNNIFSPRIFESPKGLGSPCKKGKQQISPRLSPLSAVQPAEHTARSCQLEAHPKNNSDTFSVQSGHKMISDRSDSGYQDEDGPNQCHGCLTTDDFLCSSCSKFLYRPVVLNCGRVFCESCVSNCGMVARCPVCKHSHPGSSVQVCLELHHYLERAFPEEYVTRKEEVLTKGAEVEEEMVERSDLEEMVEEQGQFIHAGTGCDGCGMFPIVGRRYKCLDCPERIGYDLCGPCYRRSEMAGGELSLAGRFNQQHKPTHHRMQETASAGLRTGSSVALDFNIGNGLIQQRRRLQQLHVIEDLDEYIDSFM